MYSKVSTLDQKRGVILLTHGWQQESQAFGRPWSDVKILSIVDLMLLATLPTLFTTAVATNLDERKNLVANSSADNPPPPKPPMDDGGLGNALGPSSLCGRSRGLGGGGELV